MALRIWPGGSKTWLFRYRRPSTGKENFLSLGPCPDITLADARRSATTARKTGTRQTWQCTNGLR
ncbi:Arm DNA-binding domain-containing protein [Paraburkholderia agricolaris]|uniref:Arm DNA-binding domain-containing protein n=1 Tax=Paraburkholderia agricolaris TaxID=2152888 RepID=UPI0038B6DD89